MSEIEKLATQSGSEEVNHVQLSNLPASSSRRRIFKLGAAAVPVVATLASKPALAWHCKSPSAWGSEIINPNTSLQTNAGHESYVDETWYITDWRDNTARSSVGFSDKPWAVLYSKYPSLKDSTTTTQGKFDYKKLTVYKLKWTIPGITSLENSNHKVVDVLASGSIHAKSTLVAQLNFLLLAPLGNNKIESCVNQSKLQKMAVGTYSPGGAGQTWNADKIATYLYENWIAR